MGNIGVGTWSCSDRERELVNQVLDSGRLSHGPMSRKLEHDFAELHGRRYGVLSNSGTSSLQVALQALKEIHGWRDGTEVIVPAVTFVATVNIVLHNRMKPVLVDVEPDYYGINWADIPFRVTTKTRAIIPVHLFGMPCDMKPLLTLVDGILAVIEDSCECMFVKHHDKMVGSWSNVACFSFYVAHLLTSGVGGISITDDPDLASKMRSLVNHGRDGIYISIDDDKDHSEEVISRRFNFETIGHSYRITELEAALAIAQLESWQDMIAKRQRNADTLSNLLSDLQHRIQLPLVRPNTDHAYMMYPIVMRDEDKWPLCYHLEEHGIETREMLRLTDQPAYRGLWNPDDYPVASWINRGGFYTGCHQGLTLDDMATISEVIHDWCRNN